jgi:hypothetical protein
LTARSGVRSTRATGCGASRKTKWRSVFAQLAGQRFASMTPGHLHKRPALSRKTGVPAGPGTRYNSLVCKTSDGAPVRGDAQAGKQRVHGSGVRVLQSTFSGYSRPGNKPGQGFRKRMRHVPQSNPGPRAGEMTSQGTAHNAPGQKAWRFISGQSSCSRFGRDTVTSVGPQ